LPRVETVSLPARTISPLVRSVSTLLQTISLEGWTVLPPAGTDSLQVRSGEPLARTVPPLLRTVPPPLWTVSTPRRTASLRGRCGERSPVCLSVCERSGFDDRTLVRRSSGHDRTGTEMRCVLVSAGSWAGAMSEPTCGVAALLRPGGPVQVPFQPCCAAAILFAAKAPRAEEPPFCPRRELPAEAALLGKVTP
jgi:hypothetical protein